MLAISTSEFSEECRASRHEGDTYFPETTNFDKWKVWYHFDNDTRLCNYIINPGIDTISGELIDLDLSSLGIGILNTLIDLEVLSEDDTTIPNFPYKISLNLVEFSLYGYLSGRSGDVVYGYLNYNDSLVGPLPIYNVSKITKPTKGFISKLIDEYDNCADYDFKNILYRRYKILDFSETYKENFLSNYLYNNEGDLDLSYETISNGKSSYFIGFYTSSAQKYAFSTSDDEYWFYTFTIYDDINNIVYDATVKNPINGYEGYPYNCVNNRLNLLSLNFTHYLPNNVFIVSTSKYSNNWHSFDNIRIKGQAMNNTIGHCFNVEIGSFNTITQLTDTIVGSEVRDNIISRISFCSIQGYLCNNYILTGILQNCTIKSRFTNNFIVCNTIEYTTFNETSRNNIIISSSIHNSEISGSNNIIYYSPGTIDAMIIERGCHSCVIKNPSCCVIKGNVFGSASTSSITRVLLENCGSGKTVGKNSSGKIVSFNIFDLVLNS